MRWPCPLLVTLSMLVPVCTPGQAPARPPVERRVTIFYTAEVHGVLEPCGCTSDPLGDVARYAALVREARGGGAGVLLVDGGGLSYPEGTLPARERAADELRAALLATQLQRIGLAAAGLGETDLAAGAAGVQPARVAVNLGAAPAATPSVIATAGGIKIGILGVADPALGAVLGVKAEDAIAAGRRETDRLRKAGAEVVIALAPVDKAVARRLGREAAVDFVVLGRQVGRGLARAESAGRAFLVASEDELQRVGRIDVVLRAGGGPLADAGGPEASAIRKTELDRDIARLDEILKGWSQVRGNVRADQTFVSLKRDERAALAAERESLAAPWSPPATGSYFTNRLVPLKRSLPRDASVAAAMRKLDGQIAALNLKSAPPPPPPEPGRPWFVGVARCGTCHKSALAFWNRTVHARAWETLVDDGKQADYKCVSCHVTGYGQVGGSSLGHTRKLEDVQCEVCHGPGSTHVAEKGLEDPTSIHRETPETTCFTCHNEHHSDTFQYQAYLRDILGPGHGASARQKLGEGPTAHQLRAAAKTKAALP